MQVENIPIPLEVIALKGVERIRQFEVTRRDIKRFAQAIGETNPLYFDEEYARNSRYGAIVAPPLFCQMMTYEDLPPSQLPPDGSPIELDVPIPAKRTVGGGSEYKIHRLVRAGEIITVTSRLKDVYAKQGKSGLLYMVVVETRFADENAIVVAQEIATYIKRM